MKLRAYNLADYTPFTDMPTGVHWYENELFDDQHKVGRVTRTLAGVDDGWMADPYWDEQMHFFTTKDEAKAWLVTMYRMGGANEPIKRRIRATQR